jgi:hypothetical protein
MTGEPVAPGSPRHLRGVLDTSTVIMLSRITDSAVLPAEPVIAATALSRQLPVYTCNPDDFPRLTI